MINNNNNKNILIKSHNVIQVFGNLITETPWISSIYYIDKNTWVFARAILCSLVFIDPIPIYINFALINKFKINIITWSTITCHSIPLHFILDFSITIAIYKYIFMLLNWVLFLFTHIYMIIKSPAYAKLCLYSRIDFHFR